MGLTPELSYTIIVDRNVYIQLRGFVLFALLFFATQRGEAGTKGNFPNCCSDCQGERADFVGGGGGAGPLCSGPFSTGGRTAPAGPARCLRSARGCRSAARPRWPWQPFSPHQGVEKSIPTDALCLPVGVCRRGCRRRLWLVYIRGFYNYT